MLSKKPPKIQEIYVRLLNYQVPLNIVEKLKPVNGSIQYIQGNDIFMSEKVNMDYFSVKIDQLPTFAENNVFALYKKIRKNFLKLSKGNVSFDSHNQIINYHKGVDGKWEFKAYPKKDDPEFANEQLRRWNNEVCGTVFYIEAGGGTIEDMIGDNGAVLESETDPREMCWIFTTIVTELSETQPFSGHRQFGIHKDEDGNFRFFARALDRVWPSSQILKLTFGNKEAAVKDYLTIADATWKNLIKNVALYINLLGGKTTIMSPEFVRTDFNEFLTKYKTAPTKRIGNIPQYKEITEDEI